MLLEQRDFREEIDDRLREEQLLKFIKQQLTEREAKAFIAKVFDDRTLACIGREHNVSGTRIAQIVAKATRKLRASQRLEFYIKIGGLLGEAAQRSIKESSRIEREYAEKNRKRHESTIVRYRERNAEYADDRRGRDAEETRERRRQEELNNKRWAEQAIERVKCNLRSNKTP